MVTKIRPGPGTGLVFVATDLQQILVAYQTKGLHQEGPEIQALVAQRIERLLAEQKAARSNRVEGTEVKMDDATIRRIIEQALLDEFDRDVKIMEEVIITTAPHVIADVVLRALHKAGFTVVLEAGIPGQATRI